MIRGDINEKEKKNSKDTISYYCMWNRIDNVISAHMDADELF